MATIIETFDLPESIRTAELVDTMIAGANAKASRVAPCLADSTNPPSADQLAEAKLVLIGAIKRWVEAGAGSLQSQTSGPFSMAVDTRQKSSGYNLWPSEIEQLQAICSNGKDASSGAFSITTSRATGAHQPWCSIYFGATYCSCGADLTNYEYPLYEGGVLTDDTY